MINQQLALPIDEIIAFCERNPIRKLSLFGSVLRDDFGPDSEVDLLTPNALSQYFRQQVLDTAIALYDENNLR